MSRYSPEMTPRSWAAIELIDMLTGGESTPRHPLAEDVVELTGLRPTTVANILGWGRKTGRWRLAGHHGTGHRPTTQDIRLRREMLRARAWSAVDQNPGIGKTRLRAAVGGKVTLLDAAVLELIDGGYLEIRSGPGAKKSLHTVKPYLSDLDHTDTA